MKGVIKWTGHAHSTIAVRNMIRQDAELIGSVGNWSLRIEIIGGFIDVNVGDYIYFDGVDSFIVNESFYNDFKDIATTK